MLARYKYVEGITNLVGNKDDVGINYLGELFDDSLNPIATTLDSDGHPSVELVGWNGFRKYRIIELVGIQYKDLRIPEDKLSQVEFFVIDGERSNTQAKNVGYRFKNGPIESDRFKGYHHIPSFTEFVVNRDGIVKHGVDGRLMTIGTTKGCTKKNIRGGYRTLDLMSPNGKTSTIGQHRVLAYTFLEYPDNADKLVVNHIDGVPWNNDLSNLEWATYSKNNYHAYEMDLRNQHIRVLVKFIRTGEVVEYYSYSECARQLNLTSGCAIRFRLRSEFGTVFQDGTQIKRKDDPRDFPHVENVEEAIETAAISIPIKLRCCVNLTVEEYDSFALAEKASGINRGTIRYRLEKDDRSPIRGYQVMLQGDNRPWPDFTEEEYQSTLGEINHRVNARNLLSGEERDFFSIAQAHKHFSGDISMILRSGRQVLRIDGWQIKLESDEKWEVIPNLDDRLYAMRREVLAREESTGELIYATSASEMSAFLRLDSKAIRKAALTRGKKIYHGYRFKLGLDDPWPI